MKTNKIIYWITTIAVAGGMTMSGVMYLTGNEQIQKGFQVLGYPGYVVSMLGIAKLLAAAALIIPGFPKIKEWAYAGLTFCFIGAFWSHAATQTPFMAPLMFLALLLVSYFFHYRVRTQKASMNEWATV